MLISSVCIITVAETFKRAIMFGSGVVLRKNM